jgi:hypothetical protein
LKREYFLSNVLQDFSEDRDKETRMSGCQRCAEKFQDWEVCPSFDNFVIIQKKRRHLKMMLRFFLLRTGTSSGYIM